VSQAEEKGRRDEEGESGKETLSLRLVSCTANDTEEGKKKPHGPYEKYTQFG
jgi:hypothetical protein